MPLTKRKRQLQRARDSKRSRGLVEQPRDEDVKQESAEMKQEKQRSGEHDGEEDSDAGFPDTDEKSESDFKFTDDERTNWGGPDALDRARDKWLADHPDPENSETRQDQAAGEERNPGPEETARIVKAVKESGLPKGRPFPEFSSEADEATEVQSVKDEGENALVPNAPVPDAPVPGAPTPKAPVQNAFDRLMKAAREQPRQKSPETKPVAKSRATSKKK